MDKPKTSPKIYRNGIVPNKIVCGNCERELPKQYFYIRKNRGGGMRTDGVCKECKGHRPTKIAPEGFKMCGKCGNAYPKTDEYFTRNRGKYLSGWCKDCRKEWGDNYRKEHHAELTAKRHEKYPLKGRPPKKTEEYYRQYRHDYWQRRKEHKSAYNKWFRETHPDYDKEWRLKNPDKVKAINQRANAKKQQQNNTQP